MIAIKKEIIEIESGKMPQEDNVLVNAHILYTIFAMIGITLIQKKLIFPTKWNKENKFWPYVSRIDNAFGDRNFFCVCPDIDDYK